MTPSSRLLVAIVPALLLCVPAGSHAGVPGATDVQPAATVLVPFFETGVGGEELPHDTLLVFTNESSSPILIHYEVWNIDGVDAGIFDNVQISPHGSLTLAMRDVIEGAAAVSKERLLDGAFYHGFVTADVVSTATSVLPFSDGYPFAGNNALTGWTYYTRLSEGSSNGLPMVHLEWPETTADDEFLVGFYGAGNDNRVEQIDADARACAAAILQGTGPCVADEEGDLDEMRFRTFLGGPLRGTSRMIVFTMNSAEFAGPSAMCEFLGTCPVEYPMIRYDESGAVEMEATVRLDHAVNIIPIAGESSGWVSIQDIPTMGGNVQVYGFVFNQAQPADASLNWDAIFEATVTP